MHMNGLKERRQHALQELIRSHEFASQDDVAERLARLGFAVTQATVSRDLEQIGAVKVRRNGQLAYALPEQAARDDGEPRLAGVFREWVRSVEPAANLVVIRTPPGSAHLVGVVLDEAGIAEIVGTICGDDTIFVACREAAEADALAARLRTINRPSAIVS
jgi:transcriptional regulator of arginine metabolism